MEYLLKASAVITIFYVFYKLFLQRDTFFESNRGFLLVGLLSAFIIPFVVIPIYIERTPLVFDNVIFSDVVTRQPTESTVTLIDMVLYTYVLGAIFFLGKFLIQLVSLVRVLINNESIKKGRYTYIKTCNSVTPFSFFKWIVYNPEQFTETELQQILTHEKVHARQHHTIDILLTQLACIALWFNPFIWLYNKDLKQNLEFIADQNAQQKSGCKKTYQYTLLKTSMPTHQLALTNNFYNSLIKKRIVMLHKSKSKKTNLLKYGLVIPILGAFLMSFNTKEIFVDAETALEEADNVLETFESTENLVLEETVSNEAENEALIQKKKEAKVFLINKHFSDSDFDALVQKLKGKSITAKFKGIKRNGDNEINAIKIELKSKYASANFSVDSNDAINSIKISFEGNGKNISIGNASHHSEMIFITKDGKHKTHKVGKGKTIEILTGDDVLVIHEDAHILNSDSIKFSKNKDKNHIFIRKEVITREGDEKLMEVIIENDDDVINKEEDIIILKKADNKDKIKMKKSKSGKVFFIGDDDGKEPILIVDGKEVDKDKFEDIDSEKIKTVTVFKGEQAIEKHGEKAKDGVIVISTKKDSKSKIKINSNDNPLIFIDGKAASKNDMKALAPDKIESIHVLKGDSAIKTYGNEGKNGVLKITTKKEK